MTVDDPQEANDSRVVERTRPVELPVALHRLRRGSLCSWSCDSLPSPDTTGTRRFFVSTTLGLDDGLRILFGSFMTGRLVVAPLLVVMLPLLVAAFLWSPSGRAA